MSGDSGVIIASSLIVLPLFIAQALHRLRINSPVQS